MRILALDYGSATCGCAISDPTGTIAGPIEPIKAPDTKKGLAKLLLLIKDKRVEKVVVGLPLTLAGGDSEQTQKTRTFAAGLTELIDVPVQLYDERYTTRLAERPGKRDNMEDSRAAAYLLDSWLLRNANTQRTEV